MDVAKACIPPPPTGNRLEYIINTRDMQAVENVELRFPANVM